MGKISSKYKYFAVKAVNLVAVVAIVLLFSSWAAQARASDAVVAEQIAQAERAAKRGPYATDGVFTGSAQGFGGKVEMQVRIEGGYIEEVSILDASKEDDAWLDMCAGLPAAIEDAQSTDIDTVSGATYTSSGILNATTEALRKSADGNG